MDEIWHYGNTGLIASLGLWLLKHTYAAGRKDQKMKELAEQVLRLREDLTGRLERIEGLLMERRK